MTRHPRLAEIGAALLAGTLIGFSAPNVLGAIDTTNSLAVLGYATIAVIELTCALIIYSMMAGKRDDRDQ